MLQSCNEFLWRNSPGASINHRGCAVPLICPVLQKPLTAPEGDQLLQKYSSPPQPKPQPVTGTAPPSLLPRRLTAKTHMPSLPHSDEWDTHVSMLLYMPVHTLTHTHTHKHLHTNTRTHTHTHKHLHTNTRPHRDSRTPSWQAPTSRCPNHSKTKQKKTRSNQSPSSLKAGAPEPRWTEACVST